MEASPCLTLNGYLTLVLSSLRVESGNHPFTYKPSRPRPFPGFTVLDSFLLGTLPPLDSQNHSPPVHLLATDPRSPLLISHPLPHFVFSKLSHCSSALLCLLRLRISLPLLQPPFNHVSCSHLQDFILGFCWVSFSP